MSNAAGASMSSRSVTRANTSEESSVPSGEVVCTVYSMTLTVIGGPSALRARLSLAR